MRVQIRSNLLSMQDLIAVFPFTEVVTGLTSLAYQGYTSNSMAGGVEFSGCFDLTSEQVTYINSPLPVPEEYIKTEKVIYAGKNQALLDAMYAETDLSRVDEAVEDFFYDGLLDSFVKYARRAGYPEEKLKWGIQRALDLGYVMPEKE